MPLTYKVDACVLNHFELCLEEDATNGVECDRTSFMEMYVVTGERGLKFIFTLVFRPESPDPQKLHIV